MNASEETTGAQEFQPSLDPPPASDLHDKPSFQRKPPRRKTTTCGAGVRLRRESRAPSAKRSSRPETPLLRWKFGEGIGKNSSAEGERPSRGVGRRIMPVVSARKLAAGLWHLRLPEFQANVVQSLGHQPGGGHFGPIFNCHRVDRVHSSPAKHLVHSPHSVSGSKGGLLYKNLQFQPSFQFPNSAMEGATKWDPDGWKASDDIRQIFGRPKSFDCRTTATKTISALEGELEQARARISELETERRSSKKKLEQFLRKLSEERAAWRSREHEKIRTFIDDVKADWSREKKNCQRLEIVNSKLVNELADAKLLAKRYLQEYEKEKKARVLIEEVCDELAKGIGEDKAEVEALKRESIKLREEVEEERKMLQMAEVWREERVRMKLVDAKVMLEQKFAQMNRLVEDLESFLKSRCTTLDLEDIQKADLLRQLAASVDIEDVRELAYEPPNPDDIFSVFQDVKFGESNEWEVEACGGCAPASQASKIHSASPDVKMLNKDNAYRHPNVGIDQSSELEEDASEWETVSHPEDQGSSYSPDGSDSSVSKHFQVRKVSRTGKQWEKNGGETPIMEISEVESVKMRQLKKVSSMSKLWRSCPSNCDNYKIILLDGKNGKPSNGRLSDGAVMSPDHVSAKGGLSPRDLDEQWSSSDSGNPHIAGATKGCTEWPQSAQKGSLKARLMEARMESQKIQLRQVLKQKI